MAATDEFDHDLQQFLDLFNKKLNSCVRQIADQHIGEEKLQRCMKSLESLERQLLRVKGKILTDVKFEQLKESLSNILQQARTLSGRSAVSTGHKAELVKSFQGPAKYVITKEILEEYVALRLTLPRIAKELGVSLSTVKRKLKGFNINPKRRKFSDMTDEMLDVHVKKATLNNRAIGGNAIHDRLNRRGVHVQRQRVRDSVLRVDPVGVAIRSLKPKLQRRVYSTPAPNSVWHIDGNHKLIRWGIVIHGGVDGYSRLGTFLAAAPNNLGTTVLGRMVQAVCHYGLPQHICVDQGVENNLISLFMQIMRGAENHPTIRVPSTSNERIERHWNDVWRGASNPYHSTFRFLEAEGFLDLTSSLDMWLLHYIYLPRLNHDLEEFRNEWNQHKLRTEHSMTPEQLFALGLIHNVNSQLRAVRDFFDSHGIPVDSNGGVDNRLVNGRTLVDVPEKSCPLTDRETLRLQCEVDPLSPSDNMGMDLYIKAQVLIHTMQNSVD